MQVLAVLFGSLLLFRLGGLAGLEVFSAWIDCARTALAVMFAFTAAAHFLPVKRDLIAMVPPAFPRPDVLVALTGIAELAGAIALLIPATRGPAALGLIVLLALMLPANISAARRGMTLRGRAATPLWLRVPMQILFAAWAWYVR